MKTREGLMRFISARATDAEFATYVREAAVHGLTLGEYVWQRVLSGVTARYRLAPKIVIHFTNEPNEQRS